MMKTVQIIFYLAMCVITGACNKYRAFNGDATISGYAYVVDEGAATGSTPLAEQTIYLNTGIDTSAYISEIKTDQSGFFSFSMLSDREDYILFTRYLKEEIEYKGAVSVAGSNLKDELEKVTLTANPLYTNGMIIFFSDTLGGFLPNLPFRVYGSKIAAEVDSAKYASYNTLSDANAKFSRFNIIASKYYFITRDTIAGVPYQVFDSVTVAATGLARDTFYLKK